MCISPLTASRDPPFCVGRWHCLRWLSSRHWNVVTDTVCAIIHDVRAVMEYPPPTFRAAYTQASRFGALMLPFGAPLQGLAGRNLRDILLQGLWDNQDVFLPSLHLPSGTRLQVRHEQQCRKTHRAVTVTFALPWCLDGRHDCSAQPGRHPHHLVLRVHRHCGRRGRGARARWEWTRRTTARQPKWEHGPSW